MGLLSFLPPKAGAGADAVSVDAARLRARRRLIGAVVLVGLGVIGFPLLFDTSPRPLALDIPIETPDQSAAPAQRGAQLAETAVAPTPDKDEPVAARAADASRQEAAPAAVPASPVPAPTPAPAERVAETPAAPAEPEPARKPGSNPAKTEAEAARALAALQDKPAAAVKSDAPAVGEAAGRFVVQVGAFSEAASARELRQRVEKLGLKTYMQAVDTPAGKRIRVRVGPYGDRGEADRAAARLKQAGLKPAVLTL